MMLQNFLRENLMSVLLVFTMLWSCSVIASAETISDAIMPPGNPGDYYLNTHFSAVPSGAWSGGGLAVEHISGTWGRASSVTYSADYDALPLYWMEATLDTAISAAGEYVFEADIMAPDLKFFPENAIGRLDMIVGADTYVAQVMQDGEMSVAGQADSFTMSPSVWYTVRVMITLPSGAYKTQIIETETGTVKAENESTAKNPTISKLRIGQTKAVTNPLYTQNWKFYKNNLGKAQPLYPCPPAELHEYYINQAAFENKAAWSGGASDDTVSGSWQTDAAVYDETKQAMELDGKGYYLAKSATNLSTGIYGAEQDIMLKTFGSDNNKVIELITLQGLDSTDTGKTTTLLSLRGTTGEIEISGTKIGQSINLNRWYTFKLLVDMDNHKFEITVLDKEENAVLVYQKGSFELSSLLAAIRLNNANTGFTLSAKNFKFYRNVQVKEAAWPAAIFTDSEGNELKTATPGEAFQIQPAVANTSGFPMDCTFIMAVYKAAQDGGWEPYDVESQNYSVFGAADTQILWSPNENIVKTFPEDGEYMLKCFVWDDLQGMKPIAAVAELKQ